MTVVASIATVTAVCFAAMVAVSSASAYEEITTIPNSGVVAGRVVFHGAVPTRSIIPNKDVDVCGSPREEPLLDVGPNQGVAGTLVYLAEVPKGKAWPSPGEPPHLNNVKCRFEPEIQVIKPGAIAVVNKDPVLHNTHGYYGRRTAFNTALPNQNQSITADLLKTGTVRVDCDAHGWMEGWIYVRDNPYYAVTGSDGKFAITDVPPGTYKLVTAQPYSAVVEQSVTVGPGASTDLTIEIKPQ